jgi:predicted Zn-dependent protease
MRKGLWAILAGATLAAACAVNPVTGQRQLTLVSESQEIAYGRDADPKIRSEFGLVDDPHVQGYMNGIGQRLGRVSHRPDLAWHFSVLDSPVINAFALPGGYLYFTRGILAYINTEAELTAVVGHEIGHVTARHSVEQMTRSQLANIGLGIGGILSPALRQAGGLVQAGLGLLFLKYGRDDEREADRLGVEYAAKAGFDPREASGFFEVLRKTQSEGGKSSLPGWLSSHPDPAERVEATRAHADKLLREVGRKDWQSGRREYLRMIDGLAFGENPQEGFVEGDRFFHPMMRFQIDFPRDWKIQNTKQSVAATDPAGEAQITLSLASVPAGTSGEAYASELARKGLAPLEGRSVEINGNRAYTARYRVQGEGGQTADVLAAFISYRGSLFQILGGGGQSFPRYLRTLQTSIESFRALNDPKMLNVQPDRIVVREARGGETLRQMMASPPFSRAQPETVSLLNRLSLDEPLPAGAMVKLVEKKR